ncbi:hypothetical protein ACFC0D_21305 [Streptomyces sp. NPDC056222]|uniref:hypothetical protein n=1 Tax=Streptomyces sp. NPDC056222 TaxID=3345749 RepID=UPI0035D7C2E0
MSDTQHRVLQFSSAIIALLALTLSVIAFFKQNSSDDRQSKLSERQTVLAEKQASLKERQDALAEEIPRVSYFLDPEDGFLFIMNKDKDAITGFYVEIDTQAGGERGKLDYLPPCMRTEIKFNPELVRLFQADREWTVHFKSGGSWWSWDKDYRVIKLSEEPPERESTLQWSGFGFVAEATCES